MATGYCSPIVKPLSSSVFVKKYPELYYEMQDTLEEGEEMLRKNDIETNQFEGEYFTFTELFKLRLKKYKKLGEMFLELQTCTAYNALVKRCDDMIDVLVKNEKTGVYKADV